MKKFYAEWMHSNGDFKYHQNVYLAADVDGVIAEHQSLAGLQQIRIEQLEKALRKYGRHIGACDYIVNELPCTCGFTS